MRSLSFPAGVIVGVVGLLVAGAGVAWLVLRHPEPPPAAAQTGGFREAATESGITWRMNFLPNEQGETFKINLYDHGSGVAVADYNGDGYDDIYLCNELGKNALYRNEGDGTFEDVTEEAGVGLGDRVCTGAAWADIENNGRPYLFVTSTRGGNVLFKNLGNGKFKDVTKKARLALKHPQHAQQGVFFDYDNDGYLDLLVIDTAEWTTNEKDPRQHHFIGKGDTILAPVSSHVQDNVLYRNNGDGTFTDVTNEAGLTGKGWIGDVAVFDYDGYLDLLVTNMFGRSTLYHNNGACL
jgi:hypothetical protein